MAALIQRDLSQEFVVEEADFRKETIYFVVVDRFFSGSVDNDEVGRAGLFDPSQQNWGSYWGGDLEGLIAKADYLKALGVTALWLSPLFEQVDDKLHEYAPMHGYWTRDFKRLNPHFIDVGDDTSVHRSTTLRRLVETMHARGIKLILDVVCNHSSPEINGSKGVVLDDGQPLADFNNDANNFYHHYPSITDWNDEFQLIHFEMMGLATFNESNPDYRRYIKSAICSWLDVGFDALRIDTVKHMPVWFWQEFVTDIQAHKPSTFIFGEYGFGNPKEPRTVEYANHSGMSILDFGLCDAIREAFTNSQRGFCSVQDVLAQDIVYDRANELVTFFDNHDMPRFLSICPDQSKLELATVLLLTLRGIPCLFYGTEQYLVNSTNGGADPYNRPMMTSWDVDGALVGLIRILSTLRQENRALAYGSQRQHWINPSTYVFSRRYRDNRVLVMLNQGDERSLSLPQCDLPDGLHRCLLTGETVQVNNGSIDDVCLKPMARRVFSVVGESVEAPVVLKVAVNGYVTHPGERIVLTGDCPELGEWDLTASVELEYINGDCWFAEVPFIGSLGQCIRFKAVVLRDGGAPVYENVLHRHYTLPMQGRLKLNLNWSRL